MRIAGIVLLALAASTARASFVDYAKHEINCKVVYYGSDKASLHANIDYIFRRVDHRDSKLVELKTKEDPDELFDFLPLSLGEIRGFKTRFHLYTTPTAPKYEAARQLILKETDGVIFVADSDPARKKDVLAAWASLKKNLAAQGLDWQKLALVVQLVHRDAPNAISAVEMKAALGLGAQPIVEAAPPTGAGVFDTLKAESKLVLHEVVRRENAGPPKK